MDFTAKHFNDRQVYYAADVNRLEDQVEALTTALKSVMALNNVWISYEEGDEPPDKNMLWIDLSDSADGVRSEIDSIMQEYSTVIQNMSEEIKTLKKQIADIIANGGGGGGTKPKPDTPSEEVDTNNYMLLENNNLMLLLEDGKPLLCENDFASEVPDTTKIDNAILNEDGTYTELEDGTVLCLES